MLHTHEIRLEHYVKMSQLGRSYNKPQLNDSIMEYDYLHARKNYNPLGKGGLRLLSKPWYSTRADFEAEIGYRRLAFRIAAGLLLLKGGYEVGKVDSKDELLEKNNVIDFETEEQIYDMLFNKNATAVFVMLHVPGHSVNELWNRDFERASSKYEKEEVSFVRVLCREHATFCSNKMWKGRVLPVAEAYYIND